MHRIEFFMLWGKVLSTTLVYYKYSDKYIVIRGELTSNISLLVLHTDNVKLTKSRMRESTIRLRHSR